MKDLGEKFQLWGTFSVWDHVRRGAFLAEVVMYDKLVVPVPPNPERAKTSEDRAFAQEQLGRWQRNGWQPQRLLDILKVIEPVVEPIEWDREHHELWVAQFKEYETGGPQAAKFVGQMLAGYVTGQVLLADLPAKAAGAVAVCPFDSLEKLKEQLGIDEKSALVERQHASRGLPGDLVSAIIGREFLIPEDPERDELSLLQEAVDLVKNEEWRTARSAFHAGMLRFVDDGLTDYDSIKSAVQAMAEEMQKLNKLARRRKVWTGVRRGFFFTQMLAQAASAPFNPFAAGQVAASIGQFTTSEILGNPADPYQAGPVGAILLDAQSKLGLTFTAGQRRTR